MFLFISVIRMQFRTPKNVKHETFSFKTVNIDIYSVILNLKIVLKMLLKQLKVVLNMLKAVIFYLFF